VAHGSIQRYTADDLEKALLQEILAHPDDDAPRLVYADLLLTAGDPRGELIAVRALNLANTRLDDESARALAKSTLRLRVLDVRKNALSAHAKAALKARFSGAKLQQ
jgi:uncharacterized protein (TIGR02996 family)